MTNTPITKSNLVSQVINASPRMYKMAIKQVQDAKWRRTTVDYLEDNMEDLYRLYKEENITSEDGIKGEVNLNLFQVKCYT